MGQITGVTPRGKRIGCPPLFARRTASRTAGEGTNRDRAPTIEVNHRPGLYGEHSAGR
jgi:hypothetical protein